MYHSSLSVFMTNNTPSGVKKHHENTEPESRQIARIFQDCWIRNTLCMHGDQTDRESLFHKWLTRCLNRAWSMILQPIVLRKPVRTDLLLCDRRQTSAQACTCYYTQE